MQLGHMRFEPNINVHITDASGVVYKTAITEIKNLNSFSVLQRAADYEVQRQLHEWQERGSLGKKSTYGWDESTGRTFHQRDKEEADDYRYFPDPDLVPVEVDDVWIANLKSEIGEMPAIRRRRYVEVLGLKEKDAALLAGDRETGNFFDAVLAAGAAPPRASALMEALRELANESGTVAVRLGVTPGRVAEIARLVTENKIAASKETAKRIVSAMVERDG